MRSIDRADRFSRLAAQVLAFSGATVLVLAGVVGLGMRGTLAHTDPSHSVVDGSPTAMVEVAPGGVVEPGDVPEALAVWYRGAESHPDVFAEVPCFCGCAAMLDHRHLLDCFVRADGDGWEAHALGCGVCLGEAEQVLALVADGAETGAVVDAVIDRWSDPYLDTQE